MARRGHGPISLHANMTPMIDVTFLLIVFFVVVSQIVDRDAVPMDLPAPDHAAAAVSVEPDKVIFNIIPLEGGEVAGIIVGGHSISWDAMDELTEIVKTRLQGGATEVHLRADRATRYTHIHKTIEAIRAVGTTPRVQLVINSEQP